MADEPTLTLAPPPVMAEPQGNNIPKVIKRERKMEKKGLSHWIRPYVVASMVTTFCILVVIAALGRLAEGFESSQLGAAFLTLATMIIGLWSGERSALKIPGGEKKDDSVKA